MRRAFIIIIGFLSIFFSSGKSYAYQQGLLEGKTPTTTFARLVDASKMTDNNLSTYGYIPQTYIGLDTFFTLDKEYTITSIYLNMDLRGMSYYVDLVDKNDKILASYQVLDKGDGITSISSKNKTYISPIHYVKKVRFHSSGVQTVDTKIYEIDVYSGDIPDTVPPSEVSKLQTSVRYSTIDLTFTNPTDADLNGTKIYLNGVLNATLEKTKTSYSFTDLAPNTTYAIKVTTFDTSGNESNGVTTTVKTLPPPDVTNLELFPSTHSILAQWINPVDSGFIGNDLYLDGNFITSLDKDATSYNFTNLSLNTSYTVKVVSKFSGGYSSTGQTATAKTTIPVEDITDLQADAKYDRVKLSWTPPDSEFFHHVKIYRKKVEQQSFWDQLFSATAVSAATTSDGYTPMFETNGTYWTDLTVTPDTTYSYKVTSVNTEGNESQGVTIETTTPSEPVPVLAGVATTQNGNGDYVVTWTSPTKGTVKVLIDGQEYTVVDAATQQVIIPKKDMKLNFFGGYDTKLVPIGEFGTEGEAVQVPTVGETKIDFPFSFNDFIQTVINILAWAAPLILLSFVLVFWRPLVEFIKKMLANAKGGRVKQ